MDIEFTNYFDDLMAGLEQNNKTNISKLAGRCLIKSIIKKESFEPLLTEIKNWGGKNI